MKSVMELKTAPGLVSPFIRTNYLITFLSNFLISFQAASWLLESTKPRDTALPTWADKCENLAFLPGIHVPVPFPLLWPSLKLKQLSLLSDLQGKIMKTLARSPNKGKERKNITIHSIDALWTCVSLTVVEISMGLGVQISSLPHTCCVTLSKLLNFSELLPCL